VGLPKARVKDTNAIRDRGQQGRVPPCSGSPIHFADVQAMEFVERDSDTGVARRRMDQP
jgi:hypothetical protein